MSGPPKTDANRLYAEAHKALLASDWGKCLATLAQVAVAVGDHAAVLHMRALALQGAGHLAQAQDCFEQAIALPPARPADPYLFANAARLSEMLGHGDRALALHELACQVGPSLLELRLARIGALRRLRGDAQAAALYREWVDAQPEWADLHHFQALFLRDCEAGEDALAAIDRAIKLRPESANARQLRARIRLDLGLGDPAEFEVLIANTPPDEPLCMGAAAAYAQQGRPDQALALLDSALERQPQWQQALQSRLAIATQLYSPAEAARWLREFVARHPQTPGLQVQLADLIWRQCGADAGLEELNEIGAREDDPIADRLLRADLLSQVGRGSEADDIFGLLNADFALLPPAAQMVLVRHLFRAGDIVQAADLAHGIALSSHLIEAWAHVELGWRILGDPRHDWLTGSGSLVDHRRLDRFEEYGEQLGKALRVLHAPLRHHPSEQSARHGTQTDGRLFSHRHPAIGQLVADIRVNVRRHLAGMPDLGAQHPLASLRGRNFRFGGSWSIRLTDGGFHTPHFHNEGLFSSACYIALPGHMSPAESNPDREGWLELGRPPAALGLEVEPYLAIKPQAGSLVLFPSFLFHGTRPFGTGERLTAAFDVTPIAD